MVETLLKGKSNSEWALKQSTIFDINEGRLEVAIEKLQKLVRIKISKGLADDKNKLEMSVLWIFLSEAYKRHGNFQSAVRACKTVLEMFPDNISAKLQVKIYLFTNAIFLTLFNLYFLVNSTLSRNRSI